MNKLEYYTRQKNDWCEDELNTLIKEYVKDKKDVNEIADIHRRTPGSISYRLKTLGIIDNHLLARGYDNYRNSKLYDEIINKKSKIKEESQKNKNDTTETDEYQNLGKPWSKEEDDQLKKEYLEDKKELSELCKLHKRNAGGIVSRLKKLYLIDKKQDVNGYSEYKQIQRLSRQKCPIIIEKEANNESNNTDIFTKIKELNDKVDKVLDLLTLIYNAK